MKPKRKSRRTKMYLLLKYVAVNTAKVAKAVNLSMQQTLTGSLSVQLKNNFGEHIIHSLITLNRKVAAMLSPMALDT